MNKFEDKDGVLIPFEFYNLPFQAKRAFTVSDVPKNTIRGNHAHYMTQQVLICVTGKILVSLYDGMKEEQTILNPGEYILVKKMVWDYQQFLEDNSVLLVLCSTNYNRDDYIEDKQKFDALVNH